MDQVFATLDPTMREVKLGGGRRVILSDTVGFISDLPTMLVAAFRATLEEVVEADIILHVRDIAHEESDAQARDVEKVLSELGIEAGDAASNIIEVWNKIDALGPERRLELQGEAQRTEPHPVLISAVTGEGLDHLLAAIDARLSRSDAIIDCTIPGTDGRTLAWLYENAEVVTRTEGEDGDIRLRLRVPSERKERIVGQLRKSGISV
jgi:GTP-binding protein HflX